MDYTKELSLKRIHKSHLQAWIRCPYAFKLQFIDGQQPPVTTQMERGTAIDNAISRVWQEILKDQIVFRKPSEAAVFINNRLQEIISSKQVSWNYAKIVADWFHSVFENNPQIDSRLINRFFRPLAIQYQFENNMLEPYNDYKIAGVVDFIRGFFRYGTLQRLEIGEIKCSERLFTGSFFTEVRRELCFYAVGLRLGNYHEDHLPLKPLMARNVKELKPFDGLTIVNPLQGLWISETFKSQTLKSFWKRLEAFLKALEEDCFPQQPINKCYPGCWFADSCWGDSKHRKKLLKYHKRRFQ